MWITEAAHPFLKFLGFFFPKKDMRALSMRLPTPSSVGLRGGQSAEAKVAGMTAWRFTQQDISAACREGELGKKCICGLLFWRKEKAEGHSGWGEVPKPWTGGRGAQNADSASRGTFRPEIPHTLPPSTPPALSTLAPWEAWNPGSFSGQKDPMTSHLLPLDRQTVRSGPVLPACQEGKGAGKGGEGGGGAGWDVLSPSTQSTVF